MTDTCPDARAAAPATTTSPTDQGIHMRATRPTRVVLGPVLALVLGLATLPLAVPASAATTRLGGASTVRVVAQTRPGAVRAVTAAAAALGATRVGRVRRLHAVSFEVRSGGADRLRRTLSRRGDVTTVGVAHRRRLTVEPADPRYPEQRTYLAAIGAQAAWDEGATGSTDVRIAVVDSGVDVRHPDLAGKIVATYNAVNGGSDVHDVVGHGTGTASVAAAATGNGVGIAGAGRDSSVLAVKVADVTGRIFTDDLARGIVWATDHGADVLNLSLGGPTTDPLERAAVAYAVAHDVLVVAAAGNEGSKAKQYPGALPGVLSVGATTASGSSRASFSSFGSWVDLAAPGRSVVAATPGGGYETADGTSYSAPLVAGAAALLAAYRPGRSAADLAQALVAGTDGARYGFAHGLLHVDRSLHLLPPGTVPTLVAPAAGTVSGRTTVAVTSSAPRVRLELGDQVATVPVTAGSAAATFETYGLAGSQPVRATDCSAIGQCSSAAAAGTVEVANADPVLTAPAAGTDVRDDTVTVSADAPADAAVLFQLDGDTAGSVIDRTAPFSTVLSTAGVTDGAHVVRAFLCRSDGGRCDTAHGGQVQVTVTRLHPALTRVAPRAISPDGDGRRDATTVFYRLDRTQVPVLRVRNAAGHVVYRQQLGNQRAGSHSATWDGRRNAGAGGVVADGSFQVEISTSDGTLTGLSSTTVTVDRTAPRVRRPRPSVRRVLPVRDRYADTVSVSGTATEPLRWLRLEVRTRAGTLVRTVREKAQPAGQVGVVWNGRRAGGALAAGSYRVRLRAQDVAGNRSRSAARTVVVSGKRLVKRSGSTTVTARSSLDETFADDCSDVFRRTSGPRDGWVSYGSGSLCTTGDAYAAGDHQVRLPAAARYGTVRLSAYGGRADTRYRDRATVVLYDGLQNLSDTRFRLAPALGAHRGPRVRAAPLMIRSRILRWETLTTGVAWYDVRSYRVDFTYFVLR